MRTTLVLDDQLLRRARQRAAALDLTLSELVNRALRQTLATPPEKPRPFVMTTFGDRRRRTRHEPADFASALEEDDLRTRGR